jgi:hypothetical protein
MADKGLVPECPHNSMTSIQLKPVLDETLGFARAIKHTLDDGAEND